MRYVSTSPLRFLLLLLLLLLLLTGASRWQPVQAQSSQGTVSDSVELSVLRQFYESTDGPHWRAVPAGRAWPATPQAWANATVADAGNWYGVSLSYLNNGVDVGVLILHNQLLRGQLPESLGQLSRLFYLDLSYNPDLSGEIPPSLGQTDLSTLYLDHCHFYGTIPPELSQAVGLRQVALQNNVLTGPLPASWGQRTGLVSLNLGYNRLTGPLPASWGALHQLGHLVLSNNQLSGPLPAAIGQLTGLSYFWIDHNNFSGPLPAGMGNWTHVNQIQLEYNQFSGELPASLARLPALASVTAHHNNLTGIPFWANMPASIFTQLNVAANYLDFADLEPQFTADGQPVFVYFDFGAQRVGPADTIPCAAGTYKQLHRSMKGTRNHYQWERQVGLVWVPLVAQPGVADTLFDLGQVTADMAGMYRQRVTNDLVRLGPNEVGALYTRALYLDVRPYPPLPLNEPTDAPCAPLVTDVPPVRATDPSHRDPVNYVRTYVARSAFHNADSLLLAGVHKVQVKTEYSDGLGRPVQTVLRQESPGGRDIVQPMAYDTLGRQPKDYLPYTSRDTAGVVDGYRQNALREQYAFYRGAGPSVTLSADMQQATQGLPRTGVPFAHKAFEASPLNRVMAQGNAGEAWALTAPANHAVWVVERPNNLLARHDSVIRWTAGYGGDREDLYNHGLYADGQLWLQQTTDEQKQRSQSFTDQEGRLVLKQVALPVGQDTTWLKTYYVYDDFGRLRAVLPPKAWQRIRANGGQVDGAGVELLLFRYHYDEQGRLIEKKVPDTEGYAYTVYDELDRPVMTQDVAQRSRSEWSVTKYDVLGRVVLTGLMRRPGQSRAQLQAQAQQATILHEQPSTMALSAGRGYYTNQAFPQAIGTDQLLSVTYYDGYDFNQDGAADLAYDDHYDAKLQTGYHAVPDGRVTGQATRSEVRVLGVAESAPGAWLTTTTFFDEKLRPLQVVATNARDGQDIATSRYDFAGKVLASYTVHNDSSAIHPPTHRPVRVREVPTYDATGRLLSSTQQLNDQAPVRLFRNSYNELGQLQRKVLGDSLQTVDYAYNIRGWLTNINNPDQLDPHDLWGMELSYACGFNTPQFNGNIAGQKWRSASDNVERAYGYRYDGLNRLLQGDFIARTGSGAVATAPWNEERGNYRFWAADYDANGNLRSLRRQGLLQQATHTTAGRYGVTDNLRYTYAADGSTPASNRLSRVDDLAPTLPLPTGVPHRPDFQDEAPYGNGDYAYDAAGSMTRDTNKGITRIRYNHLHLPQAIGFSTGDSLVFHYSAAGQKVAKLTYTTGKPAVQTDYVGAWQYEKDSLRWLSGSEGRVLYQAAHDAAGGVSYSFVNEYTLKDHLGNLRVAFHKGGRFTYYAGLDSSQNDRQLHREQREFDSVSVSKPIRTRVGNQFARSGDGVARLNAGGIRPTPLGPTKQLAVAKGDTLNIKAYGLYNEPSNANFGFALSSFVLSLFQPPAVPTGPDGIRRPRVLPLLSIGLATIPVVQQLTGGVPRAYLRVLVFNQDSVLQPGQCVTRQLTAAAQGGYEPLSASITLPQAGYVTIYVANESNVDVDFDDITIEHRQGLQVQENHYDPFGLDLVGLSRGTTPENKYTFNGKERQDEFGLNWHDHGWRFYDPALGRWVVSDPDAEEEDQESWGTYQFGLDNAVRYNDLDGRKPGPGDGGTVAGTFYNTAVGIGVSIFNTAMMLSDMPPNFRASVNNEGGVDFGYRAPATSLKEVGKQTASDVLDVANTGVTLATSGAGTATKGAGMLLAKTVGTKVAANSVTQAGKKALTIEQQAKNLIPKNAGKNSVTINTKNGHTRYDLGGKTHGGVPTPHKQSYKDNIVNGQVLNRSRTSKTAVSMDKQDVRTVRRYLERRP